MSDTPSWTSPESGGQPPIPPPTPGYGGTPGPPGTPAPAWGGSWGAAPRRDMMPGVVPLRPLGLGEILDGSLTTIRHYPKATIGLAAIVATVSQVIQFGLAAASLPSATTEQTGADFASVVAQFLSFVSTLVLAGMITVVVGQAVLGRPITLGQTWAAVRPRVWALIGVALLTILIVAGVAFAAVPVIAIGAGTGFAPVAAVGVIAALVGFAYFVVSFALATPALVLEGQTVTQALRRSWTLVKGAWWRCAGILLLAAIIAGILSTIIQIPFVVAGLGSIFVGSGDTDLTITGLAILSIGGIIASAIVLPFLAGVVSLTYVDRRFRVEGLDVTLAETAARSQGV